MKRSKVNNQVNLLLIAKLSLFAFVLVSPFINFAYASFLDFLIIKVALLLGIIYLCFVDFQLALIATIAFLILVINLNNDIVKTFKKNVDTFADNNSLPLIDGPSTQADRQRLISDHTGVTQNVVCSNEHRNEINEDLLGYFIDDKIKPYEIYIKMMVSPENIDKAQGLVV